MNGAMCTIYWRRLWIAGKHLTACNDVLYTNWKSLYFRNQWVWRLAKLYQKILSQKRFHKHIPTYLQGSKISKCLDQAETVPNFWKIIFTRNLCFPCLGRTDIQEEDRLYFVSYRKICRAMIEDFIMFECLRRFKNFGLLMQQNPSKKNFKPLFINVLKFDSKRVENKMFNQILVHYKKKLF